MGLWCSGDALQVCRRGDVAVLGSDGPQHAAQSEDVEKAQRYGAPEL